MVDKVGEMWYSKHRQRQSVLMARRIHPFPSRTRKLSYAALKILGGKLPGKIGRCQHKKDHPFGWSFLLHCNCFGPWSIKAKRQLDGQSEEMSGWRGRSPVRGRPAGPTDFIGPFSRPPVPPPLAGGAFLYLPTGGIGAAGEKERI